MENGKKPGISRSSSTRVKRAGFLLIVFFFAGCSGHGIYIMNDPLRADEHNDLAVIYEKRGDYELAIQHLKRAIRKDRENPLYRTNRGNVRLKMGDEKGALKDFEKATEIDPDFLEAINNLCFTRASRGLPLRACPGLIERQLASRKELPREFYDTAGLVYTRMEKPERAKEMYEGALARCGGCSEKERVQLKNMIEALKGSESR